MTKPIKKSAKDYPFRQTEVPITQGMLYGVRDELKSDIRAVRADMKSLRGEMASLDARVASQFHRLTVLVEEQNAKNNVVLDGLGNLFHRQERIENEMTDHRKFLATFKHMKKSTPKSSLSK